MSDVPTDTARHSYIVVQHFGCAFVRSSFSRNLSDLDAGFQTDKYDRMYGDSRTKPPNLSSAASVGVDVCDVHSRHSNREFIVDVGVVQAAPITASA